MPIEVMVPPTEYLLITTSVVAMEIQPCPQIPAQIGEFLGHNFISQTSRIPAY